MFSIGGGVVAAAALAAAGLYMCARSETPTTRYPTYAEAVADGAIQRGWIPGFVPSSATTIEETHNIDTNWQWLEFTAPPEDLRRSMQIWLGLSPFAKEKKRVAA